MYKTTILPNGLTVVTAEMPHMTSVSVGLWVGVGGRYEPAQLNGVCHFIEHMLFKGTKRRTARQISQDVEGIGGYLNAFTSEEMTCYHSKACHNHFDELLDVMGDMFLESKFTPEDVTKERSVIKEELNMYLDQPHQRVQELLNEVLWPNHPLGRPLTGTEKTLDGLHRAALVNYQRTNYTAERTVIAAAGRLNHEQVVKAAKRLSGKFPKGTRAPYLPAVSHQTKPEIRLETKETEQTQVAIGIRTCARTDDRRYPLRLLNIILGENMSSRLFQVIREDRGLAYSIYSGASYFDDAGSLTISSGLDAENLPRALKLIAKEIGSLIEKKVPAIELRRAKDFAIGQIELGLENTDTQMMWLGEQMLNFGRVLPAEETKKKLQAATVTDVQRVARAFFRPEHMNVALVSPLKSDKGLLKALQFSAYN